MHWIVITLLVLAFLAVLTYLALPGILRMLGLHRHYTIPEFDLKGRRALVVCASHDRMGPTNRPTGAFGSEFTVPCYAFVNAGMEVDPASPTTPRSTAT